MEITITETSADLVLERNGEYNLFWLPAFPGSKFIVIDVQRGFMHRTEFWGAEAVLSIVYQERLRGAKVVQKSNAWKSMEAEVTASLGE